MILLVAAALRLNQLATHPPGPHYDEAANLILTRTIAFDGASLFPIAENYQGRESLYFYINAPLLRLIGDNIFTMRLSSAFMNLITIAATITLGRLMVPGRRGVLIGLIAGALITVSFHQILMSRQTFRAISLPMMQALGLLCLFRGMRAKRGRYWLVAGGVLSGGALYTYMASRLFPLWLALAGAAFLFVDRQNWRRRARQGGLFFGAMGLTLLPLAVYAVQNPDIFFQRLTEVSDGAVSVSLSESAIRHLEMFFIEGDSSTRRYNILGRPYFTPLEGLFLLMGLALAARRLTQKGDPITRAGYALALLAPLMVIPSVISVAGFPPSHMRSLGMVPMIFIAVAAGAEAALTLGLRLASVQKVARASVVLVAAATAFSALWIGAEYRAWAVEPALFDETDADLAAASDWLQSSNAPDYIYVAALHREHPTLIAGFDQAVTWMGADSLFLPPAGEEGLAIFSRNTPPPAQWRAQLEQARVTNLPLAADDTQAFWAYRVTSDTPLPQTTEPGVLVRNAYMTLAGLSSEPVAAGESGHVATIWTIDQPPPYSQLRPVLDLRTPDGDPLATSDAFLLGTDRWRAGETMLQRLRVAPPVGTPPGDYPLFLAWVDRITGDFISFADAEGAHAGVAAQIGTLEVTRPDSFPSPDVLPITTPRIHDAGEGVRLLGWDAPADLKVRPGESLPLALYWQAAPTDTARDPLIVNAALENETTQIPMGALAPDFSPDRWRDNELIADLVRLALPIDLNPGAYTLTLTINGERFQIASVRIEGVPRVFEPPPVDTATEIVFDDGLSLYGYTVSPRDNQVEIELIWQARAAASRDYAVFVHLVDDTGRLADQRDGAPVQNSYPTTLWAPGEYVRDRYIIDNIAPGTYEIRVGLYTPEDGVRLSILTSGDISETDFIIIYTLDIEF